MTRLTEVQNRCSLKIHTPRFRFVQCSDCKDYIKGEPVWQYKQRLDSYTGYRYIKQYICASCAGYEKGAERVAYSSKFPYSYLAFEAKMTGEAEKKFHSVPEVYKEPYRRLVLDIRVACRTAWQRMGRHPPKKLNFEDLE